ncbi:MAG: FdhD protein [Pseudonocardiales bacterium]|nr:FdhD protein [Pseudonocardiales bacterium]
MVRLVDDAATVRPDTLAVEEPLEIRVRGKSLAVTMRTPGDDFDLAAGFLVSEGVVRAPSDIASIRYCAGATADGSNTYNVLDVCLAEGVAPPDPSIERNFYTTSSCGLCGKASLDAVRTTATWQVAADPIRLDPKLITEFPTRLRAAQRVFDKTGGLHAAGLFDADGNLLCLREDVGRHNAVDKVVGWATRGGRLPLTGTVLMVSGRASFELVQKAVMAGIPVLTAVSAPSSLAADLAEEMGVTLVGFLRGTSMNVYTGGHRLGVAAGAR